MPRIRTVHHSELLSAFCFTFFVSPSPSISYHLAHLSPSLAVIPVPARPPPASPCQSPSQKLPWTQPSANTRPAAPAGCWSTGLSMSWWWHFGRRQTRSQSSTDAEKNGLKKHWVPPSFDISWAWILASLMGLCYGFFSTLCPVTLCSSLPLITGGGQK